MLKEHRATADTWLLLGLATIAAACAAGGWSKLQYGLSFIDEGMYLTDSWRLANGDNLFPDANRFAASFYHVILSPIFSLFPNAGVLAIRKIQFFLNLIAISLFLAILLKGTDLKQAKGTLFASSPFLYLGLDPTGMGTSLNYYTITSFFFILHIASAIAYTKHAGTSLRTGFAILSGIFIALAGISYLAIGMAGLVFLIALFAVNTRTAKRDALAFILPALLYPILIYPNFEDHWLAITETLKSRSQSAAVMNSYTLPHILHGAVFALFGVVIARLRSFENFLSASFFLAITLLLSYRTGGFDFLPPFWNGWFKIPGMVATLNFSVAIVTLAFIAINISREGTRKNLEAAIVILGYFIYAMAFAATSSLGVLLMLSSSAVLWIGTTHLLCQHMGNARGIILALAYIIPSSVYLMHADYQFTYFDKPPSQLNYIIQEGPARGIKTNEVNGYIEKAIREIASDNSKKSDFILSFDQTPMAYFLTKRRPAVDHSWIGITGGNEQLAKESLQKMILTERLPTLAFHWRNKILWLPQGEDLTNPILSSISESSERPFLSFVRSNMDLVGNIEINEQSVIEIYKRSEW